jgi:hypothetical protein
MTGLEVRWSVFRTGLLRSAGFPFEWLDDLASKALEHHSTLLVDAHARRDRARADALRALWERRGDTQPGDMPMLNRAIRKVRGGKTVAESHEGISAATAEWNVVAADFDALRDSLRAELDAMLPAEYEREVGLLLKHVASEDFKDAVQLSSPLAYEAYCRASNSQGFRRGKDEQAAYRFLQRFCAKNETGGSIGPVNLMLMGSAREGAVTNSGEIQYADDPVLGRIEYTAGGDGRSAERRAFLSYWAACEIGRSLIRNMVDARDVRRPYRRFGAPGPQLSEVDARLLGHLDGQRSISELAADLELPAETVDASVARLADLGLVEDEWRVSDFTTDPGEDLRKLAARIGTPDAKRACQLIADVKGFAQAPLQDRPALLSAITREFSGLTDKPAWRGPGLLRADRAVLYEEATGNIQGARIDPAGAQRLAERLSTALEFLASLAIEKRVAGQSLLAEELARRNVRELPATEVRDMARGVPQTSPDHRERFLRLVDPSASFVEFSRQELTEAGLIRGDLSDWPIFGAADLMLTGPDDGDAAEPGSIILSELHHIWPTLGCWVRALYDDSELGNEELWHIVAGELAPAVPTLQEIVRHEKATDSSPYGHAVLCLDAGMPVPGAVTVPAERAVVRRWQNGFIGLHDPADRRDLWLLPEYDDSGVDVGGLINCAIPALALSAFTLGPYTPRIIIDGVVIQRRRWEIGATDIPSTSGRVPTEREWLTLQIWRRNLGLPRRMYFLPDTEGKPVYLDFASVLSVANFLRCLRSAQRVVLTEALPDPERLWLNTKDGTLTSEIRTLLWRDRRTASPSIHPLA